MSVRLSRLVLAAALLVAVAGCSKCGPAGACADIPRNQEGHGPCSATDPCTDHYSCKAVNQEGLSCCVLTDRQCETEANCCPGQTCSTRLGICDDKRIECSDDAACGTTGDKFCETWTDA